MRQSSALDPKRCDRARLARDPRFDGRFITGVLTTRIYCRPTCPVKPAKSRNVVFFPTAAAAERAGFRPCLRCRPEAAPGTPAWRGAAASVTRALRLIADGFLDDARRVEGLAEMLGMGPRHLRRLFVRYAGASPREMATTVRVQRAKRLIDETAMRMSEVAFAAGFGSIRRFNTAFRAVYGRPPTSVRGRQRARGGGGEQSHGGPRLRQDHSPARPRERGARGERRGARVRSVVVASLAVILAAGATSPAGADPASDAPDHRVVIGHPLNEAPSYEEALKRWRKAEDVNAWIGANFQYDTARAVLLSETQRGRSGTLPIYRPDAFFVAPRGVCVDLSRFAVETLRAIDPESKPAYVMFEFDPASIAGNVLRRHWIASFQRDGRRYFFADSKRPGHIAGPYESTREFIEEYARFRGRRIVAFRETESYERTARRLAVKQRREDHP